MLGDYLHLTWVENVPGVDLERFEEELEDMIIPSGQMAWLQTLLRSWNFERDGIVIDPDRGVMLGHGRHDGLYDSDEDDAFSTGSSDMSSSDNM
jgi:hypothetical protein